MPYYPKINVLFIHIPKTGGTTLENFLKTKSNQTLYNYKPGNTLLPNDALCKVSLQHQTYSTLKEYSNIVNIPFHDNNLKVITIVRNPYNRIISDLFWFKLIKLNDDPNVVYNAIINYVDKNCYDNHNLPQYKFVTNEEGDVYDNITIFRTESLTTDIKSYGFSDFRIKRQLVGSEKEEKYKSYLNDKSIAFINKYYSKDFDLFSYDIETP